MSSRAAFLIFLMVGFLVYSNTFSVPFHFDDAHVVSELSFEEMLETCRQGGARILAHLTFLLNYWLHGRQVFGYHLFNLLVHIATAFFVYLFLFQVLFGCWELLCLVYKDLEVKL